jgi:hypothetical protein
VIYLVYKKLKIYLKKIFKKIIVCLLVAAWLLPTPGFAQSRASLSSAAKTESFASAPDLSGIKLVKLSVAPAVGAVTVITSATMPAMSATPAAVACVSQTDGQINLNQPANCFSLTAKPATISRVSVTVKSSPFPFGQVFVYVPAASLAGPELKLPNPAQTVPILAVSFVVLMVFFESGDKRLWIKKRLLNFQKNTASAVLTGQFEVLRC